MPAARTLTAELRYRLLLELSQKTSGTFDLREVLTQLLESIRAAIEYDAAGVFVLNRSVKLAGDHSQFAIAGVATTGYDRNASADDPMLRQGKGIVGYVARTGQTVIAPDVRENPHYVAGRAQSRSEVAVPIVSDGHVIGALDIESDRLEAYTRADAELLEFFANAAAIPIEKAILHGEVMVKQRMEDQLRIAPGRAGEPAAGERAGGGRVRHSRHQHRVLGDGRGLLSTTSR